MTVRTAEADAREAARRLFARDIDDYIAHLEGVRRLSPNSVRAYREDLVAFLEWSRREAVVPSRLTHRDLRSYLLELTRAGYSTRTISRHLSSLRGMFRWMYREGRCDSAAVAAVASPKLSRRLPKTMSDEDVRDLLATCDEEDPVSLRDRAFLEVLYATGARISEVSALDLGDIDFSECQVRLFGKGSKERVVPVYRMALDRVVAYLERGRPALVLVDRPCEALLLSVRGNRMSADALRTVFKRRVAQARLDPSLTPHAMRHTFATELLGGGADLRSVQELLGHESLATTQIYTHLSIERLKEAARSAHPRS